MSSDQPATSSEGAADAPVTIHIADSVAIVTLQSEPLGVLSFATMTALTRTVMALDADRGVRAAIVTGRGRAFSVGGDIKEFRQDRVWLRSTAEHEHRLYREMQDSRIAFVAACNGLTLGGGLELALACDLRVASNDATFGVPEVRGGGLPGGGGTQRLPRLVGLGRALDLMLSGRTVGADEAFRIGLVDRLVAPDALMEEARLLALGLADSPGAAIAAIKRCTYAGFHDGAGMALEIDAVVELGMSEDAAEGARAFIEKRPPTYRRPMS